MPTSERLISSLRFALRHLYDPIALRTSALIEALGLSISRDPASELRHILTQTIRSLQPEADTPAQTEVWRVYEILLCRYVQRCSQLEVADQLGMSIRHLGRVEQKALQVLADRLRQETGTPVSQDGEPAEQEEPSPVGDRPSPIRAELAWLESASSAEAIDLAQILPSVLDLVQPLARQHQVSLEIDLCPGAIPLAAHPVALRQIFLSLLSAAIRQASGRRVSLTVRILEVNVQVRIRGLKACPAPEHVVQDPEGAAASLEMARHLIETCGGGMALHSDAGSFVATATLPALEQLPVLVIDDNANALRLLQRYASNTRYRVIPATSLPEGLALAREVSPRIIVLDVMMPEIDGWEALGRLRQHPLTSHVPVIVCTILAEEELALSLGANGFVRKPVSREAFLSALDRQAYRAEPGSR